MPDHPTRRWNGWGEASIAYSLSEPAIRFLKEQLEPGSRTPDASYEATLRSLPVSRLPAHPLISCEAADRLAHARGQSLPDWIALRSGRIGASPDGVAYPSDGEQIRRVIDFASQTGAALIPYGGGTSVLGHINPTASERPNLTVDLRRISSFVELDRDSRLATFGAGVRGPQLEGALNHQGFTLGHFPQSWEYSTLGGWIATRSCGQQSLAYGRIEDLFAGGALETPVGSWRLEAHPASAAGPDLRQLVLGSEGRLGMITEATVRVRPLPAVESFRAAFFQSWEAGLQAAQALAQSGTGLSMLRLSDPVETRITLALSGKERWTGLLERGLQSLGYGFDRCLLIYGLTGERPAVERIQRQVRALLRWHNALYSGGLIGRIWESSRFRTPYLRNTLWDLGYALDTLETAAPWSRLPELVSALQAALSSRLETEGESVLCLIHLSHVYQDGASIYLTYLFPRKPDPDRTLNNWAKLKTTANEVIQAAGATISHQHGVGLDHAASLPAEKGKIGMRLLDNLMRAADPEGMMNPEKLLNSGGAGGLAADP